MNQTLEIKTNMDTTGSGEVRLISQCTINAHVFSEEYRQIHYLTPWDFNTITIEYIQFGLLFAKPETLTDIVIERLKTSLSQTLNHFPTLTGRLATKKGVNPCSSVIYLDCTIPPGALFIQASTELAISDVFSRNMDIPKIFKSFFHLKGDINYEGHTKPLLAVQVTELVDGIFIGCSVNHTVVDGTGYWNFLNTWAEMTRNNTEVISRPPIMKRWFMDTQDHIIELPYTDREFTKIITPPALRARMFHFSVESIARLKAKANAEAKTNKISSFQALNALVWRSMTRARKLALDQMTVCTLLISDRSRLRPAISDDYFGNCIELVSSTATAGELLGNNLGWAAWRLHEVVKNHTEEKIRTWLENWVKHPSFLYMEVFSQLPSMAVQNSPRFDVYGNDFGWGKPLCVRSAQGKTLDGNVVSYPGRDEKGSIDFELSLSSDSMSSLLLDDEFVGAVSFPVW